MDSKIGLASEPSQARVGWFAAGLACTHMAHAVLYCGSLACTCIKVLPVLGCFSDRRCRRHLAILCHCCWKLLVTCFLSI